MARAYQPKRHSLTLKSSVSLAHLLAAREDLCNMVKTSSESCRERTTCAVNKVSADSMMHHQLLAIFEHIYVVTLETRKQEAGMQVLLIY